MFAQWKSGSALRIDALAPQLDDFYCAALQVHTQRENTLYQPAGKLNHEISLALQLFLSHWLRKYFISVSGK